VKTADTMAAIKLAKERVLLFFGVCNVVGSSISRESHAGAYTHAGPEIVLHLQKLYNSNYSIDYDQRLGKLKVLVSICMQVRINSEKVKEARDQ
jgi:glucosamine--fructose-6-phosphate aminotransferase (isomerizing)